MKQLVKLNAYQVETITVCPYCMNEASQDESSGCCGESSAHFDTAYQTDDETYLESEVELVYPILDVLRYEVFNLWAWRLRVKRWQRLTKDKFTKFYDGNYPSESLIRKLRRVVGFQYTTLDRLVLERLHGSGTIWCYSQTQLDAMRKDSVKRMRESWAKGELLGCNLYPPIQDNE